MLRGRVAVRGVAATVVVAGAGVVAAVVGVWGVGVVGGEGYKRGAG